MLKLYIIIFVVVMSFSFPSVTRKTIDEKGLLRFSTGELYHLTAEHGVSVRSYLESLRDQLGVENAHKFPLDYYKEGKNNTQHFSFKQTYKGIPVFGRYIRVHIKGDVIKSISSNIDNIDLSIFPQLTRADAIDLICPNYIYTSTYLKYQNLQIYIQNRIPHLVHTIDAVNFEDPWRYIVDAHTGEIVDRLPLIFETDYQSTGY